MNLAIKIILKFGLLHLNELSKFDPIHLNELNWYCHMIRNIKTLYITDNVRITVSKDHAIKF